MARENYTVGFMNIAQCALYNAECRGQISDGCWENAEPRDHWKKPSSANAFIALNAEQLGTNFNLLRYYDFARKDLLAVVADRMIGFVKYYTLFPEYLFNGSDTWNSEPLHSVADLNEFFATLARNPNDEYWQKKKAFIMELHGITEPMDLFTIAQRVQSVPYDMQALRKDLHEMKKIMHCRQAGFRGFVDNNHVENGTPEKSEAIFQASNDRAAPVVKVSKGRRPYKDMVGGMLRAGCYTSKQIVDAVFANFQGLSRSGVETAVSDLKNPKYSMFKDRVVVKDSSGVLKFQE